MTSVEECIAYVEYLKELLVNDVNRDTLSKSDRINLEYLRQLMTGERDKFMTVKQTTLKRNRRFIMKVDDMENEFNTEEDMLAQLKCMVRNDPCAPKLATQRRKIYDQFEKGNPVVIDNKIVVRIM